MFQSVLNAEAAVRKAAVLLRDQMPYIGPSPPPGFDEARGIYANIGQLYSEADTRKRTNVMMVYVKICMCSLRVEQGPISESARDQWVARCLRVTRTFPLTLKSSIAPTCELQAPRGKEK